MRRKRPVCRRQFLTGAGGVALGLPFLPSLATGRAFAADPLVPREKYFYGFMNAHGAAYETSLYPAQSTLTQSQMYADAGHTIRWGNLQGQTSGGNTSLSPILTAPSSVLTDRLIGKITLLKGLDGHGHFGHNEAAPMGGDVAIGERPEVVTKPTIDQIIGWSPSFYPDLSGIRERVISTYGGMIGNAQPGNPLSPVQNTEHINWAHDLFDRVFVPQNTTPDPEPTRPSIVNRIMANYRRLRDGNRRISQTDRQRLDDHVGRLDELERKLSVRSVRECRDGIRPAQAGGPQSEGYPAWLWGAPYNNSTYFAEWADIVSDIYALAFSCGSCRAFVANFKAHDNVAADALNVDWHQEIAHQWQAQSSQQHLSRAYQFHFEHLFARVAAKLDAIETTPGCTILDDAVMVWTQETGMNTHSSVTQPVIMAGSAGGYFKPGKFVDYGNRENPAARVDLGNAGLGENRYQYMGLSYNQWLANILMSMDVQRSEFELWGHRGYGRNLVTTQDVGDTYTRYYRNTNSPYFQIASDPLPAIT